MIDTSNALVWSGWQPLLNCWRGGKVPARPGLYRLRRVGQESLDYLGETGAGSMTLRRRLGMLKGVYNLVMPYRAPHTAGPALWAILQATGAALEVSCAVVEGPDPWRKGLEALAIGLHRQEHGRSPTVNFGRMPAGYRASSSNNRRLALLQRRFRGGPCQEVDDSHAAGIAPLATLAGNPESPDWCGHAWSDWQRVDAVRVPVGEGLYRLRRQGQEGLLYVGQGKVGDRLAAHRAKCARAGHRQGVIFGSPAHLECSWVLNSAWLAHQRLELETDLLASHLLVAGAVPPAQFLGEQNDEAVAKGAGQSGQSLRDADRCLAENRS
jgi:hypothetical protein